ncbi:hypothetical protein POTOM_020090 [Populus tomentosa]|uniref:Uncharacterized protein n=1 Tax=Populus tomentosa TaxID=118781 RepID=A0A8X8D3R8_POPTO|nr:hypothetical protein POTOM_020090 [Populus tomentosa]
MAISKLLIVFLVASLLVLHLVEADQKVVNSDIQDASYTPGKNIGVPYPLGHVFARGLAGLAVHDASVSPRALPATMTPALAMPP